MRRLNHVLFAAITAVSVFLYNYKSPQKDSAR